MDASPTDAERAAVDELLGAPAANDLPGDTLEEHVVRGGREAAENKRHLLLPALHAVQAEIGWISPGSLNYVCRRLTVPPAEAYGVATFYALLSTTERPKRIAHVCDDIACKLKGADALCDELDKTLEPGTWHRSPCLGQCERGPAVLFQLAGDDDWSLTEADAKSIRSGLAGDTPRPEATPSTPQTQEPRTEGLRLLRRVGVCDPTSLDDYREHGGYTALRRALNMGTDDILREIKDSGLRGRGGAAFPMGIKWDAVAKAPATPHYVVCNADESEPGTFKDRVLMEEDPFAIVESMTIAGFATRTERGYIYIRGEYPLATTRLQNAIDSATRRGFLGGDVMGSGFRFDIEIRCGAGAYICGEETALFNSIEGFRGEPRNKPPFPTQVGLFGKPTVVNNVETLANVLDIVTEGGPAFAALGSKDSTGPKLFCVSGHVARPGVYEVSFGTTLGELLDLSGAATNIQAVLLGGAAGTFLGPDELDVELTFDGTRKIGASLGSGVVMVFDDSADMTGTLLRVAAFFRDESCGQCVPCRVGTVRVEEALRRMARSHNGDGAGEVELIDELARVMKDASICGLGHTAASAIQSALTRNLLTTKDNRS
jgi:NADH-quinone oxidoreductase subunit F